MERGERSDLVLFVKEVRVVFLLEEGSRLDPFLSFSVASGQQSLNYCSELCNGGYPVFKKQLEISLLGVDQLELIAFDLTPESEDPIGRAEVPISDLNASGSLTLQLILNNLKRGEATILYQLKKDKELMSQPLTFYDIRADLKGASSILPFDLAIRAQRTQKGQSHVIKSVQGRVLQGKVSWGDHLAVGVGEDLLRLKLVQFKQLKESVFASCDLKPGRFGREGTAKITFAPGQVLQFLFMRGLFDNKVIGEKSEAESQLRKAARQARGVAQEPLKEQALKSMFLYDLQVQLEASEQVLSEYSVLVGLICGDFNATTKRVSCDKKPLFKEAYCVPVGGSKALNARVDFHSVKDNYTFGYKAIALSEFGPAGGVLLVTLHNTSNDKVGTLKMNYAWKGFQPQAYLEAATRARQQQQRQAVLPRKLVMYDARINLHELSDITRQQIKYQLRVRCGPDQVKSAPMQSDNLRT